MTAAPTAYRAFWPALCLPLILGAALVRWWGQEKPPALPSHLDGWDIPRLLRRLESRGLDLRPIAATRDGPIRHNVYLTLPGRGWAEVNGLLKLPAHIDRWRGTVYCEVIGNPGQRGRLLRHWGDCGLGVGPFVFFGDRALLRRIRAALVPDPSPAPAASALSPCSRTGCERSRLANPCGRIDRWFCSAATLLREAGGGGTVWLRAGRETPSRNQTRSPRKEPFPTQTNRRPCKETHFPRKESANRTKKPTEARNACRRRRAGHRRSWFLPRLASFQLVRSPRQVCNLPPQSGPKPPGKGPKGGSSWGTCQPRQFLRGRWGRCRWNVAPAAGPFRGRRAC
jgi:hypothetical protein